MDRISREVGNAVSVRNLGSTMAPVPTVDGKTLQPDGGTSFQELPYTKIDLIPPAQGAPDTNTPGVFRDPVTGKIDPTLTRPKGDINLPVAPGQVYVRWWVGLNSPAAVLGDGSVVPVPYNEPYTGIIMARNGARDNLFVLHRGEVQPFIYRLRKDGAANSGAWRPNLAYFHSDDDPKNGTEFDTRITDLDDPYFFVPDGLLNHDKNQPDPDKNNRVLRWAGISVPNDPMLKNGLGHLGQSTNQTEVSRYDMVRPTVQGSPPQPVRVGGQVAVVPLVQFRPTRVTSAPASPSAAARPGEAVEGLDNIGPDTYKTERGLWANAIVRYYPAGFVPGPAALFEIANVNVNGGVTISAGGTSPDGLDTVKAPNDNFALFDLQLYEQMLAKGQAYPFTNAAVSADLADLNSKPSPPGRLWTPEDTMRATFTPFRVLTATGKIITSFPIEEVGVNPMPSVSGLDPNRPNLPFVGIGGPNGLVQSPTQAGTADANAPLSPVSSTASASNFYDPNRAFNRLWNAYPELQGSLQRFIDLRFVTNEDGTFSPLCPVAKSGEVRGFNLITQTSRTANGALVPDNGGLSNRVRIVPGSDEVYGPDQTTTNGYYGAANVRYTRVTGNPGPNQYRLVYADLPEPTNEAGQIDYTVLGLPSDAGFKPKQYDSEDLLSAAFQPRYKAGYLQLCSDPNVPLPAGRVTVRYRFQFNGPRDTFAVDHDTREILQVLLTIKNYPQSNAPNAQTVTLKSTATLRNALR